MSKRESILAAAVRETARSGVRGLRVDAVARRAGVSTALVYYYVGDRPGLLRETFAHVQQTMRERNERARASARTPDERLARGLLAELDDTPEVVECSAAWNELRAAAAFDDELRAPLREWTEAWNRAVAADVRAPDPDAVADRLTALCEALCARWLSASITSAQARALMRGAIDVENRAAAPTTRS